MPTATNIYPLESLRENINYHPFHFWGLANSLVPLNSDCNLVVTEYDYQAVQASGRDSIRRSIAIAEARLRENLNFSIGPHYLEETLQYPRPVRYGHQFGASIGGNGRWLNVRTTEGYIRALGIEARTTIDLTAAVVYSDSDGDGLNDTFTLTVSTALTNADEIAVYFTASDRLNGEAVSEKWRILPVQVTFSGGVATIKGKAWQLVKPIKYQGFNPRLKQGIDPSDSANFVTQLAVYRRFTDGTGQTRDTAQAVMIWETEPFPAWATCCNGSNLSYVPNAGDPNALAYAIARGNIRDAKLNEIYLGEAIYNSTTSEWNGVSWNCRQPDRVIVRYCAGVQLGAIESTSGMTLDAGRWDEIIYRLALAELANRICACQQANIEISTWQFDRARSAGANDEQYRVDDKAIGNPLGTRAGHIYAWNQIKNLNTTLAITM
jgi:hypothetical protein